MLYMIDQGWKAGDMEMAQALSKDYQEYLKKCKREICYRKENIAFISTSVTSNSNLFFFILSGWQKSR